MQSYFDAKIQNFSGEKRVFFADYWFTGDVFFVIFVIGRLNS